MPPRSSLAVLSLLLANLALRAEPTAFVWAEGERPTAANVTGQVTAGGNARLLSDGQWLHHALTKEQLGQVPADGYLLRYDLAVNQAGEYQVWARVGFERVRPPLEWRIGDGGWQRVEPETHTTSLMRLATWTEVAWEQLGTVRLPAGPASLHLRFREPGRDGRLIIALDALCLSLGDWVPEGRLKPGEQYAGETDQQAAAQVFRVPQPTPDAARASVPLTGLWQVARFDDPDMDQGTYEPVKALPTPAEYPLRWLGVPVPSSLWDTPETFFGHRVIYRTRLEVPAAAAARGCLLHFSGSTWIASVFVNGRFVTSHKGVLIPWDADLTGFLQPGLNELCVAVKGSWYAQDPTQRKTTIEALRNVPPEDNWLRTGRWVAPLYPSTKGDGAGHHYGLVNPVTLLTCGPAHLTDAFVRTRVAGGQRLDADLTLANPSPTARRLTLRVEAVDDRTGAVARTFEAPPVSLAAGETKTVAVGAPWPEAKLWWPVAKPDLYRLRTTLLENDQPVDVHEQPFGFREVTIDGTRFRLNGVIRNFWNWVEVSGRPATPEEFLAAWRQEGNRFYRFSADAITTRWFPTREQRLDFYDRHGIPGRLSTCIDGMFINYDLRNPLVWENFGEHLDQLTRAYRNHPSIMVYSIENELLLINGQNVFGSLMDQIEAQTRTIIDGARRNDSTRPYLVDGGGALQDQSLEVHCPHYPEPAGDWFPANAFTLAQTSDHAMRRWPWDRQRPMLIGEHFFYAGKLEDQAWIGGDRVFRSRDDANVGAARYARLLVEGYRWQGVAGFCPWVTVQRLPGAERCFSELAAFPRRQAHRCYGGRRAEILVKVFNDTLDAAPVTFEWAVEVASKRVAGATVQLRIERGTGVEQTLAFTPPAVTARTGGSLLLRVSQAGRVGYEERLPVAIFPPVTKIAAAGPVLVLDRSQRLGPWLAGKLTHTTVADLTQLPPPPGLLLIGPQTLTADEASSPALLAYAARGGRVVVLEQDHPLTSGAWPTAVQVTSRQGGYAFPQALGTPLFRDLGADDLTDWAGDHPTYQAAWLKPGGGARSLVEAGPGLNQTALLEAPCGAGVIVGIQLRVGAKLGLEPAADTLLRNAVEYYGGYRPATGVAALVAAEAPDLRDALAAAGVRSETVASVAAALDARRFRVALVHASAANLAALEAAQPALQAFHAAGGWVMLCGLDPTGLARFNRLVGYDHQIRPFRVERVTLEAAGQPLTATLGNRDLTFYDVKELLHGDRWLSGDVYTHVVEGADVAPFCRLPEGPEDPLTYQPTFDDKDPFNFVNGCFNSDSWRYIRQIWVPETGAAPLVFGLRRPATIERLNLWNNLNYWAIEDVDVVFDGDAQAALRVTLEAREGRQEVVVNPPRTVKQSITLQIRSWRGDRIVRGGQELRLVGLDNVQFLQRLPAAAQGRVQPLDNVGGLVAYPRGRGGWLLNQLKFAKGDPNPANGPRKVALLGTLLQNLGVASRSSQVLVPGVNVAYTPLDLTRFGTRHLGVVNNQPGLFGDRNRDLRHLPVGEQYLAGIAFQISDYRTAPVPAALVLADERAALSREGVPREITGLPVGRAADTLYFLHGAHVRRPVSAAERARRGFTPPVLLEYVVHYADGTAATVPVVLGDGLDHWQQAEPTPLPNARVAWSAPFPGAKEGDPQAVLYAMTWRNPRPETPIASLDLRLGPQGDRAQPVVLAITCGARQP